MDISKFDFTKFSKKKYEKIIAGNTGYIEIINVNISLRNGDYCENVPCVSISCWFVNEYEDLLNLNYNFTPFDVYVNTEKDNQKTKDWRQLMVKEFGEEYYNALKEYLKAVKETKIQKADEEYKNDIEEISNLL